MAVSVETPAAPPVPAWQRGKVASWLTTVDHKRIGILYIASAGAFFVAGGIMAELIRTQLMRPGQTIVTGADYNGLVTIHGTTMVFLVVIPMIAGLGNFLVPLMIGASDMAFPRLNALSYWLFLFGGVILMLSFWAKGGAACAGWTSYPPLSEQCPGHGQDLWILAIHLTGVSSLIGAINFIVTIHNMRTRGMTWTRLPLFVWAIEVYAVMLVLVLPALSAGLTMLLLDRRAGTHFFDPAHGRPCRSDESGVGRLQQAHPAPVCIVVASLAPSSALQACVVGLAVVVVGHENRPGRRPPGFIGPDNFTGTISVGNYKLGQEGQLLTVGIALSLPTRAPTKPTVAEKRAETVFPRLQLSRDFIRLVLKAEIVGRPPGSKVLVSYAPAVEFKFV